MTPIEQSLEPGTAYPVTCHLLRLPGELRNRIYRLIVSQHFDQSTMLSLLVHESTPPSFRPLPLQPYIAATCHQVRHEVLSIFFGERTFRIDQQVCNAGLLKTWSDIMRPSLPYLRCIQFSLDTERSPLEKDRFPLDAVIEVCLEDSKLSYHALHTKHCECRINRCIRDVEAGIIGSPEDNLLIRVLSAWDLPERPGRNTDKYLHCSHCGRPNSFMSLRNVHEEASQWTM